MTVSSEDCSIEYATDGVTAAFAIPFPFFSNADIQVSTRDAAGDPTILATGFTVTGEGTGSGTCTLNPVLDDVTLVIERVPQFLQQTDYVPNDRFPAETNEADHDRDVMLSQHLKRLWQSSIRFPTGDASIGALSELPSVSARKSGYLGFDAAGQLSILGPVPTTTMSKATIGAFLYERSAAEIAGSITPSNYGYAEGDIRRYGALTGSSDNSTAINAALTVSSHSGCAVHVPAGTWAITSALVVPGGASIYGHGRASVISVAHGVDGLQFTSSDDGITAQPRFIRDIRIVGTLSGTANAAKGINIAATVISHTLFSNVAIFNFQYGMFVQGLYYSTIQSPFIQNCYHGIYFNNQSVNIYIQNPTIQLTSSGTVITAAGDSTGISCTGAPEVEGLHIQGGSIYGYDFDVSLGLIFECQINAVDISYANKCPVKFASTIGGIVVRDCWVELGNASGTWNDGGTGTGNLCGIFIAAITPSVNAKVHILNNYIISDVTIVDSTGVYVGNGNAGALVHGNQIIGFDVCVGGGNSLINTGSASAGLSIKHNTLNCVRDTTTTGVYSTSSSAINLNSLGSDMEIGPNYVIRGTGAAASVAGSATVTVPNQATAGNQQFPVGTPVQCTISLSNGPQAGVTYYVLTSSTTAVTLSHVAGGAAIAWSGTGSIGSLLQAPVPVTFTAGTPAGTSLHARGAFHMVQSDPALSGVMLWQASGKGIYLYPTAALTGSSGGTSLTITGLPAFLAPTTTQNTICGIENGSAASYGLFQVTTAAAINVKIDALANSFSGSGTKGLLNTSITYSFG